jgi:two-component system, chemotaxis family, CheB/CheR fusion protein
MNSPGTPSPLRVLLVDDCPDTTRTLHFLLSWWGHEVVVCHDGPSALDAAAEHLPPVVLLDLGLPGMDGYEMARRLRALPGMEAALLVATTGYADEPHRNDAHAAGFDYYLAKPFDLKTLEALLAARAAVPE